MAAENHPLENGYNMTAGAEALPDEGSKMTTIEERPSDQRQVNHISSAYRDADHPFWLDANYIAAQEPSAEELSEWDQVRDYDEGFDPRVALAASFNLRPKPREQEQEYDLIVTDDDETGNYDPQDEADRLRRSAKKRRKRSGAGRREHDTSANQSSPVSHDAGVSAKDDAEPGVDFDLIPEDDLADVEGDGNTRRGQPPDVRWASTPPAPRALTPEDLDENPVLNGCRHCLDNGVYCSMRDNEYEWPCAKCTEESCDCVLVTPTLYKQACTGCLVDYLDKCPWLVCSHLYDAEPHASCRRCRELDRICVAGPEPTRIKAKKRLDGEPMPRERPKLRSRTLPRSCEACQAAHQICSLHHSQIHGLPACTACEMNGLQCKPFEVDLYSFEQPNAQQRIIIPDSHIARLNRDEEERNNRHKKRKPPSVPKPPSNKRLSKKAQAAAIAAAAAPRDDRTGMGEATSYGLDYYLRKHSAMSFPTARRIRTRFHHPITFDYTDENEPCSFCSVRGYEIIGMPERTIDVDILASGRGLREVDQEYSEPDWSTTKVCVACTEKRVRIIECQEHNLQAIEEPSLCGAAEALARLRSGAKDIWCSLCCNLAEYKCCTEQRLPERGAVDRDDATTAGCGLCLCNLCAIDMSAYNNDLDTMLSGVKNHKSNARPLGYRADWDLLKAQGLLMRQRSYRIIASSSIA